MKCVGNVNLVRVLHLLEHAQKCVAVFNLRYHGGADARREVGLIEIDCGMMLIA